MFNIDVSEEKLIMIKTVNLKKIYHMGSETVIALDGINISMEKGELVALSGASGSGKTTLLNLIGTLDSISEGDILFDSKSLKDMHEKEKTEFRKHNLGFIFQNYNLIPVLTALENVELAFKMFSKKEIEGLGIKNIRKTCLDVLKDVGLEDYADRKPGELSGGQQQRVSIARAVVRKPKLILADEPTANLDSKNSKLILDLIKHLNEKYGITIIYSSHDELVLKNVRRIIQLSDGKIIGDEKC